MLNQCQFIGNLGADPEIKSFSNGGRIANLRIGVTDRWNDRQSGERKERTEWVSVSIKSDGLVGVVERFLKKGSKVFIQGKLQTRKYQAQDGSDRYATEVVLQGPGATLEMLDGKPQSSGGGGGYAGPEQGGGFMDDDGDDVPFIRIDHSLGGRRR